MNSLLYVYFWTNFTKSHKVYSNRSYIVLSFKSWLNCSGFILYGIAGYRCRYLHPFFKGLLWQLTSHLLCPIQSFSRINRFFTNVFFKAELRWNSGLEPWQILLFRGPAPLSGSWFDEVRAPLSGSWFDEADFSADREDASDHLFLHEAEAHG